MPSPFPGMDPYLEHPEFFPGLHDRLMVNISDSLNSLLSPPYYAEIASRIWLERQERRAEPDVNVLRSDAPSAGGEPSLSVLLSPVVVPVIESIEERRETSVEIYTIQGGQQLVTSIEILSPSNKRSGEEARELYRTKQRQLLRNRVSLVEIDLLRGGEHTTCVPREEAIARAGSFEYHICIRRLQELDERLVYPVRLEQRLPSFAIPLLPGDAEVVLDLQKLFDRCYDSGPYRVRSPYHRQSEPPLTSAQTLWAEQLLRERGLLS